MTPRNFGDPAAEYDAVRQRGGVLQRTDRTILRMHGRDPMRIIQGIITNDVVNAAADRVVYGAFLTPKGKMIADVRVIRVGERELLLDVPSSALATLLELFKKTIPPLFARFEDVSAAWALIGIYGPQSAAIAREAACGAELPVKPHDGYAKNTHTANADMHIMSTLEAGSPGYEILVSRSHADELINVAVNAGAARIGDATLDVARIEAGTPRWGAELNENTIPLEAGLLGRGIATNKGCYTGQEVIVRIMHRGHVNWRMCGFLMGDAPTPPAGAHLTLPEQTRNIARITSAAFSPELRQTIALGYLRREIETPAQLITSNGGTATAVTLPFPIPLDKSGTEVTQA